MLQQINRKECLRKYPQFPTADNYRQQFFFPETAASFTLTLASKTVKGHISAVAKETIKLLSKISTDSVIFLGDFKRAWRYQDNEFKSVKEALEFLEQNGVNKKFDGVLLVQINDLPTFLKHVFWLQRCNATLPDFHFMDKDQRFVGYICKYGNLHFHVLATTAADSINRVISERKFQNIMETSCSDSFSKTSAIKGRQIII